MSGHTYTHTHIHTYTQDNYSNPRCACAPRVNYVLMLVHMLVEVRMNTVECKSSAAAVTLSSSENLTCV